MHIRNKSFEQKSMWHNFKEESQLIEGGFQLVRSINETTAIYKKRKQMVGSE
jgi:hypothetical protein